MAITIKDLKGMTPDLAAVLKNHGINNSDQFLKATRTPGNRKDLATLTGVPARDILELANRADLSRVKGVGGVYSDLLERAGVDTVKELATRRADNLYKKILETNDKDTVTAQLPAQSVVTAWVEQAKALPKILEY